MLKKLSVLSVVLCISTAMYAQKNLVKGYKEVFLSKIPDTVSVQVERPVARTLLGNHVNKSILSHYTTERNTGKAISPNAFTPLTPNTTHTSQNQQQEIIQALQKVIVSLDDLSEHVLWWNQFFAASQKEVARVEARLESLQPVLDVREKILKNAPMFEGYQRPDYGAYAKQIPYIYLTDASGHGIKTIVNEVKQALYSVRRANPQKRILLALEFASMQDMQPPIRFAGQENDSIYLSKSYRGLVPVADELDMDILALDDDTWVNGSSLFVIKIGNYLVTMDNEDHPDFVQNPLDLTDQEWRKFNGFINISSLGVRFRNEQWANYINAVKPFYDIIIAYVGNAHTNDSWHTWRDVPELVGEKYAIFNFYAAEKESQEQQEFENAAEEQLNDSHSTCRDLSFYLKKPEPVLPHSPFIWEIKKQGDDWVWYGKEFWYLQTTEANTEKYIQSLPAQEQRLYRQAQEALREAEAEKLELIEFNVFLPQWPQGL